MALFPRVKRPRSVPVDGQHRHIVAVVFGDSLLDLQWLGIHKRSSQEANQQSETKHPPVGHEHENKSPNPFD